ncbi:UNVERIFIED_ORG: methyl-accepting chemotaxis protein [Rhizobium esperanzae]
MARKTIKQRITLDGGKEIEAQLKALGAAGEKAFDQIKSAASKVDISFGKRFDTFAGDLATTGKRLALVFAGLNTAALAAVGGIAAIAKSGADAADAAGKAAQAAGLQIDAYGRLAFAAEQNDVAAEEFGAAMSKLNKAIGEAAAGGKDAAVRFAALGVSIKDIHGRLRPTEDIVRDLAGAFAKMPDGAKKSAAAIDLFGKSGASLLPFLNEGKQGLIDLGAQAEKLGIVFTAADSDIGDAMGDALSEVSRASKGIGNQLGLLFAPTITAAAERLRDVLIANRDAILGFGRSLAETALPIVQDFISALAGDDNTVKNIWILEWRDAVVNFGESAKAALTDIFIPALTALRKALDVAAEGLRIFTLGFVNISGTTLAIVLAVGQVTGALRLLRSTALLAWEALKLLRTNPLIAVATAVAAGIALWATRTDSATAAMERHKGVVDDVDEAYRRVGLKVANLAKDEKNQRLIDLREELKTLDNELPQALDKLKNDLSQWLDSLPHAADPMIAIVKSFVDGSRSLESFTSAIREMGAANPQLGKLAQQILAAAKTSEGLSASAAEARDRVALLTGQMSDAAFIAKYFGGQVAASAADTTKAGTAAADTQKKVEALGKTITVHSSDGSKPVQQTFDLVDGVAKAADASKQSLDGVSDSAAKAGETVAKVKDDVSNLIIHVPDELKGTPTVADAMTQGLSEVPAAAKAAADGVIAEVSRVPQAVAGALSGGVQQGQGDPGAGNGGGQQQAQPAGGIADTLAKPFEEARDRIATALTAVPTAVTTALQTVQTAVAEGGAALGDALVTPFEAMANRIKDILERMTTTVQSQFDAMLASVRSAVSQLQSAVAQLESLAARAEAAASRARSASAGSADGLATGGLVGRFAGGGRVSGPGTGTSDSILARLSNGEFVIRKAAVDKYGSEFLAVLNSARLSGAQLLSRLRQGFANGGPVDLSGIMSSLTTGMSMPSLVPAFADGGAVAAGGGRPINLTIEGQTYQMIAPEDVADRLAKHQGRQGLRKAGKMPSWK